jgi:hypothetical protein
MMSRSHKHTVKAGLVPTIHALTRGRKNVDARHKAGHDDADRFVR